MWVRNAFCLVHKDECSLLRNGLGLLNIAGTPCIAWSDFGSGEGLEAESTGHFLIWCGIRIRLQEPIIILENVKNFPIWLLVQILNMYFFDHVILSPDALGWPIARERKYCVFLDIDLMTCCFFCIGLTNVFFSLLKVLFVIICVILLPLLLQLIVCICWYLFVYLISYVGCKCYLVTFDVIYKIVFSSRLQK